MKKIITNINELETNLISEYTNTSHGLAEVLVKWLKSNKKNRKEVFEIYGSTRGYYDISDLSKYHINHLPKKTVLHFKKMLIDKIQQSKNINFLTKVILDELFLYQTQKECFACGNEYHIAKNTNDALLYICLECYTSIPLNPKDKIEKDADYFPLTYNDLFRYKSHLTFF